VKTWLAAAVLWASGTSAAWGDVSLIEALKANNHDAAVALIEQGADVREREVDGTTALHWAVHNGDAEVVNRLIRARADVAAVNDYGATPMSEAAITADTAILKSLLRAGANVDSPNAEGQTALMAVARTGNVESAQLLLSHRARIDATEQWGGQTALMWAAAQSQPEMVKFLVARGANVNARGAVRDWQRRVTAEGRPKNMNRGGFTPLLYAAREGCIECVRHLLKGGANIDLPDPDGATPLLVALLNMHFDLAAQLIAAGADVNKWDFYGQTPLYTAIDMHTLPVGGRPDLPSTDDSNGLQIAELLLKAGANPNAQLKLRPRYRNGVFDRGGDQVLSTGATPLLLAAKTGDAPVVTLLLQYHALVNLPTATGVTPLMAAAGMGHSFNPTRGRFKTDAQAVECLRLIKVAGGEINAPGENGLTALHAAAARGWNETVKVLVADGAQLEATDRNGLTPIDYAAGRHERAFLEPEHKKLDATIALLRQYIVAATGREPKEFDGTLNRSTRGTGAATN
jgi:ankyrin repeat protein